ncbi:MAG TPA: hypothetical protein EYP10_13270, partial [Armatimonadetes bacterium]|nr:hypothetical protein [Armatimonadota bacterium]
MSRALCCFSHLHKFTLTIWLSLLSVLWTVVALSNASAIDLMTRESEIDLGRRIARLLEQEVGVWDDPFQTARVQRIGYSIVAVCSRKDLPYQFKILNMDEPNALALPGGPVYITRGLLNIVDSDDELAFVIGHEVGHIVGRHARKLISQDTLISLIASIFLPSAPRWVQNVADILHILWQRGYSRNQEREADNFGLRYMIAAGYNPIAALTMLRKLGNRKLRGIER